MTPVEIIALILIIVVVIKIIVLLVNPTAWMNLAKNTLSKSVLVRVVSLVLAAVVLYYLLQEITIVQIFAVVGFVALLLVIGLAPHIESLVQKYEAQIKRGNLWKENWLYTLVWIALMVWALKELFM